jgi:hypothetical protein
MSTMSQGSAHSGSSNGDNAGGMSGLGAQDQEARALAGNKRRERRARQAKENPDPEAGTKTHALLMETLRSVCRCHAAPPPPRPRSPLPAGDPRESGGVAQSSAMSAMEAALLEVGGDSDGIVASFVRMWQD